MLPGEVSAMAEAVCTFHWDDVLRGLFGLRIEGQRGKMSKVLCEKEAFLLPYSKVSLRVLTSRFLR